MPLSQKDANNIQSISFGLSTSSCYFLVSEETSSFKLLAYGEFTINA